MKKIGTLVLRGQVDPNVNGKKLQIFDGKYTTGYKVVSFRVSTYTPYATEEIVAKLHTGKQTVSIGQWDWGDDQEIAWAVWGAPTVQYYFPNLVDPNNLVIEDLYISNYSPTGEAGEQVNYFIELEKYEFPAWTGAGAMVTNQSQAGSS